LQFAACKGDSNTTKGPNARKGWTPDRSGAASRGAQVAEARWERGALRERANRSESLNRTTLISLGRWRPTWRVLNPIGCCEYVFHWRRACHLVGSVRNRTHFKRPLKCDDSFPRVRIGLLLIHLAIIISQGRTQSGSPPRNGRALSSSSPEHHQDWSVRHHVHACFLCFLQGIKQA
jgi:hypothetical protein